jgi:hypothetical protein
MVLNMSCLSALTSESEFGHMAATSLEARDSKGRSRTAISKFGTREALGAFHQRSRCRRARRLQHAAELAGKLLAGVPEANEQRTEREC